MKHCLKFRLSKSSFCWTYRGKTTTLAKIAAQLVLEKYIIGLITADTYRIAAVEQFNL